MFKKNAIATAAITAISAMTIFANTGAAHASNFTSIRIGDKDGLGYGDGNGYKGAYGGSANIDGKGVLGVDDFIPDLNQDGVLATGKGDDFDNRSAMEKANNYLTGSGFIDKGSSGSKYTDISLSTSFIKLNNRNTEDDRGFTLAERGDDKIPTPGFVFDFFVAEKTVKKDSPMFFNLLFGDYDVKDAKVQFTTANGTFERQLTKQNNNKGQDGLIQSAFVEFGFDEIFTATDGGFNGFLEAKIIAKDEPYLVFDYAELSTKQISLEAEKVPEPTGVLGLMAVGLFGGSSLLRRQQKKSK